MARLWAFLLSSLTPLDPPGVLGNPPPPQPPVTLPGTLKITSQDLSRILRLLLTALSMLATCRTSSYFLVFVFLLFHYVALRKVVNKVVNSSKNALDSGDSGEQFWPSRSSARGFWSQIVVGQSFRRRPPNPTHNDHRVHPLPSDKKS